MLAGELPVDKLQLRGSLKNKKKGVCRASRLVRWPGWKVPRNGFSEKSEKKPPNMLAGKLPLEGSKFTVFSGNRRGRVHRNLILTGRLEDEPEKAPGGNRPLCTSLLISIVQ